MTIHDLKSEYGFSIIFAGIILLLGLGFFGAWYGYSWYFRNIEIAAHKDLAESLDEYQKQLRFSMDDKAWSDIERAFETGAKRHTGSKLYPYFLAYQADALIHQGKLQEALNVLSNMLPNLTAKQELYYLYATKKALLQIDMEECKPVQKCVTSLANAIAELERLSKDNQNPFQDMATYYLGLNTWDKQNKEQAKSIWQTIVARPEAERTSWYSAVQEKLGI